MKIGKLVIEKRKCIFAGILGILTGFSFVFGWQLQTAGAIFYDKIWMWLLCCVIAFVSTVINYLILSIDRADNRRQNCKLSIKLFSIVCFIFLYVCWGIQLLGVYPGFFNYDAPGQWEMYTLNKITAHHPVLHTLMISKCIHASFTVFGTSQPGVFVYNLIQMLVSALAFTQVFRYMYKKKTPIIIIVFTLLFCGVFPTIVLSVLSVTKDSLFAPLLLSFVVSTIEILEDQEAFFMHWPKMVLWGFTAILMTIMRNNAVYVAIPFFLILILVFRKYWKRYILLLIGMILCYGLYVGPFTSHYTVDGINEKEYLSVPCQQVMRVYHTVSDLDINQKETIESLFEEDALLLYVPKIADVAKGNLRIDLFDENKEEYLKFWIKLGIKYPVEYCDAFLVGNYGFWYPWATLAQNSDGTEGYWVSKSYNPVWNESKIYPIMTYYTALEYNDIICRNTLTMWLFAPATYFWITMVLFTILLYRKRRESIVFAFVLLIWMTFLLGPVALVRYVSFLYYLLPYELALFMTVIRKND